MKPSKNSALAVALALLLSAVCASADSKSDQAKPKKLSEESRKMLLRNLTAEMVFSRKFFPMGKTGLTIKDGQVSPNDAELRQMVADSGPAAKPGDRVKITQVIFKGNSILLEINGGPIKKKKWYDRIQVGSVGGSVTPTNPKDNDPDQLYINARGSYVALAFKDYVPEITTEEVKRMLEPVFDWKANSMAEAYTKALPPKLQQAIKDHKALVGMDREMVVYAKGRPERKHRERDAETQTDYEEWIYGAPPQEVEFVRFVGNTVTRIETMKVDGEKIVRTNKEIDLDEQVSTMAQKKEAPAEEEKKGPTLLRQGEKPAAPERQSAPAKPRDTGVAQPRSDGPPGGDNTGIPGADTSSPGTTTGPPR